MRQLVGGHQWCIVCDSVLSLNPGGPSYKGIAIDSSMAVGRLSSLWLYQKTLEFILYLFI